MKTIQSLVMMMVAVAVPTGLAHAAERSGNKPSTPVMGQSMEKTTAKPAATIKAKPAAKITAKITAKPAAKNAVKKERKQKAQGDTRVKNSKNTGGRDTAA